MRGWRSFAPNTVAPATAAEPQMRRARRARLARPDFESMLDFQLRAASLPVPQRQVRYASGRRITADFGWPAFMLLVEVQGGIWRRGGGAHSHPIDLLRDIEKYQLALLNGWTVFPVTTDQVKNGEALKLIELALKKKGWKP